MQFIEVYYYITNKPYFFVCVLSNGRVIKKFVQLAAGTGKGEDIALINKSLKAAWWKPDHVIIDKLKFLVYADINNAIPLLITKETIIETHEYLNKQITVGKIQVDKLKLNKETTGETLKIAEISFPPTLLYQKIEAHFVKEIQAVPPSKWEELKWVFIAGFIVLGFIAWNVINSGGVSLG